MNLPQVSVIMPAFNVRPWLSQAVASVRLQTGVSWELLIIDDGSTDGTRQLAERHSAGDDRIRLLSNQRRKGVGGARNTGLAAARGEACMFLDSDDALFPKALESLHAELQASGKPAVRGLSALFCMQRWLFFPTREAGHSAAVQDCGYPLCGFWLHMIRTDFLRKHAILFPEDLILGEDRTFLCQVYALLPPVPVVRRPVYLYRINHKRIQPSAAKALSFILYQLRARAAFERHGREDWVAPYLEQTFLPLWLLWLHAAREESREQAMEFLGLCRVLLAGLKDSLLPSLSQPLGATAPAFLRRLEAGDTNGMLAILEHSNLLVPYSVYMGINRKPHGLPWLTYRALSWIRNVLCSPGSWRIHCYLLRLRLPVLRRRPETSAGPAGWERLGG